MRYLNEGYYLIVFSPVLSLVLYALSREQMELTGFFMIASIIVVQMCGMVLYLVGLEKPDESPVTSPRVLLLTGIFLVFWGTLVSWWAINWYNFQVQYYPEKPITFWGNIDFRAYIVKNLLWVPLGLVLITTHRAKVFEVASSWLL